MSEREEVFGEKGILETVRCRPNMYVGSLANRDVVPALLERAVQELAFPQTHPPGQPITVTLGEDGMIVVGRSGLEITEAQAVAMFADIDSIRMRGDGLLLGGQGAFVNALSEAFVIELIKDGKRFVQRFVRGVFQPSQSEPIASAPNELRVSFKPDASLLVHAVLDIETLSRCAVEFAASVKVPIVVAA